MSASGSNLVKNTQVTIPLIVVISASFAFSSMLFTIAWNELNDRTEFVYAIPEIREQVKINGASIKVLIGEVGELKGLIKTSSTIQGND